MGTERGLAILSLYKRLQKAVINKDYLYLQLDSIDILRVGKARERNYKLKNL